MCNVQLLVMGCRMWDYQIFSLGNPQLGFGMDSPAPF